MITPSEIPDGERALSLSDALLGAAGTHVTAVLLFGSRLVGTSPDPYSAYDFIVVVERYLPFYRALSDSGHHRRSPRLLSALARVLPPNIVAFMPDLPGDPVAKCMVLSGRDLERALSPDAPDHFVKGRLSQSVGVLHVRDRRTRDWIEGLLADARRDVLDRVGPYLDGPFDATSLPRRMLEVSYRGEVRPEAKDRVTEVYEAQREALRGMYGEVLDEAVRQGRLRRADGGRYAFVRPPGGMDRLRAELYFFFSKIRATARWLKHVVTFNDWLTYIRRKVERRTGREIHLTRLERKLPLLFLWPRVIQVVLTLPAKSEAEATEATEASEATATTAVEAVEAVDVTEERA